MAAAVAVELIFRPMRGWKGPSPIPPPLPSRQWERTLAGTLTLMRRELGQMGVRDAMIETEHTPDQYTIAATPRDGEKPRTASVQVWFRMEGKDKCLPSCAFRTWQDNLLAVALTLERQRMVREYGVVSLIAQMAAFDALPAGPSETGFHTVEDAARFLLQTAGMHQGDVAAIIASPESLRGVFRQAASKVHPDKPGGNKHTMDRVNAAKTMIEQHGTNTRTPAGASA